jgi:hypothetical protein
MPIVRPPPADPGPSDRAILAAVRLAATGGDGAAARRELAGISNPVRRAELTRRFLGEWAAEDPLAAAEFAGLLPDWAGREEALRETAATFARKSPAVALGWAHGLARPDTAGIVRRAVAEALAATAPRAGAEQLKGLSEGAARDEMIGYLLAAWVRRDWEGGLRWLRELPDDGARRRFTAAAGFELAQKQPERAVNLAETLAPGRDRWLLVAAIAQTWVATDQKSAVAWANGLPPGEAREAALAGIETGLGVPVARRNVGAPVLRGSGGGGRSGSDAVGWADLATPDFAAWLATQSPGLSRNEAIVEYVRQRAAAEPGAVGAWLQSVPGGSARDEAIRVFVEGVAATAPAEAARWLATLARSDRSDALIERTARQWLRTDPVAAEAWLRTTPLAFERQELLLREAGR